MKIVYEVPILLTFVPTHDSISVLRGIGSERNRKADEKTTMGTVPIVLESDKFYPIGTTIKVLYQGIALEFITIKNEVTVCVESNKEYGTVSTTLVKVNSPQELTNISQLSMFTCDKANGYVRPV